MDKKICTKLYAQERNGEPFVIDVEAVEENWDFRKSHYTAYELNAWVRKVNGERTLVLSVYREEPLSLDPEAVSGFVDDVKALGRKLRYRMLTEETYRTIYKTYFF